jgi:hypothetical protein
MKENKMIIKNVRVKSCRVDEPNDNDKFQLIFAIDDKKDHKKLVALIDDDWAENKGDLKNGVKKPSNLGYFLSEPNDEYPDDQDTGTIIFIATKNAVTQKGKEQHVPVFKANGAEYEETPAIGAGTIINLSTDAYTWEYKRTAGTKLNLNKIQVMELVEYSGGSSDTFGNESGEAFEDSPKKKKGKKDKHVDPDEDEDEVEVPKKHKKAKHVDPDEEEDEDEVEVPKKKKKKKNKEK